MAAVLLSPWLFASAEPWAYLFICLLLGIGVTCWLLSLLRNAPVHLSAPGLTIALTLLLVFVLAQMLPLPCSLVKVVSPLSAEAQRKRIQLFEEINIGEFLSPDSRDNPALATLSASPASTRRSLYLLAACIGIFVVMANAFSEWPQLRKAGTAIAISSFLMAVFALIQKFSGTSDIYWFHTPRFGGMIFGPFTNRDHFAAYMNMAFGLTLGLLLVASRAPELRALHTWRERVAWLGTGNASRITLLGFAAMLMGATVCVTLSRGGITSLAASLGIVGTFVALRSAVPNRGRVIAAVVLLVVAAVIWLGWQPVVERLGTLFDVAQDPMSNTRSVATLDTLRILSATPIFGCGFGSFQYVFPMFQSPSIQVGRFWHAHNDYAQLLAEGGILGLVLVVLVVALFARTIRKSLSDATSHGRLLASGLAVGIVAITLHSFLDYSLHRPANAFLFATLCGMTVAAVHLRQKGSNHTIRMNRDYEFSKTPEKPPLVGAPKL